MAMKNYSGVWKFVDDDGNVTVLNNKTDKALTQSDRPADAKVTGDSIRTINTALPFTIKIDDVNKTINFIDRR